MVTGIFKKLHKGRWIDIDVNNYFKIGDIISVNQGNSKLKVTDIKGSRINLEEQVETVEEGVVND